MNSIARAASRSLQQKLQHKINPTKVYFSTTNLSSLIDREIREESEVNPIEIPEDLLELKSTLSETWTIVDGADVGDDGATIKMYKKAPTSNGSKVMLKFHCQDTEPEEEGGLFESEEDEELSPPLSFEVKVSRAGKTMTMECISEDAEASVEGITMADAEDLSSDAKKELYRGPILEDLPDDVKEELNLYLREECMVDGDVAAFTAMYADYKEQVEYIKWLKDVKKIVD